MLRRTLAFAAVMALAAAAPAAAVTVDGTRDPVYGSALTTQTTQTNFGDANSGQVNFTNGSELDGVYARKEGGTLHLFLTGNLESNFNKLDIFFDVKPGGQNKLRGDNSGVDFGGLNRMGDSGSGDGLRFDADFAADYWMGITGGDSGGYKIFCNYAEILTGAGGSGYFLGEGGAAVVGGALMGGNNPNGIRVTVNNSNTAGVGGGCAAASGGSPTTGIELQIPYAALGAPGEGPKEVKVCAFINGGGHDFVSNQMIGPLPAGTCNLGEPRNVNLSGIAGNQYASFATVNAPAASPWLLLVLTLAMGTTAVMVLRRRAGEVA